MPEGYREPPAAPLMIDADFPFEGAGRARKTCDESGYWCHLACHADMASSLADSAWNASVKGLRWFGEKGVGRNHLGRLSAALQLQSLTQGLAGNQSSCIFIGIKRERIWVRVVQNC